MFDGGLVNGLFWLGLIDAADQLALEVVAVAKMRKEPHVQKMPC